MMSLLVHNLPPAWGDQDLRGLFSGYGSVLRVMFVCDRARDNVRFAFVDMARPADAARATQQLNGRRIDDRRLIIETYAPH